LKSLASSSANEQVQVGSHVGVVVDPNSEATRHRTKRLAHGALVLAKGPRAARPVARQNDVHGPSHADRAVELATAAPDTAAVLGSNELGVHIAGEERPLMQQLSIVNQSSTGNV
jgi:hypothetical protein